MYNLTNLTIKSERINGVAMNLKLNPKAVNQLSKGTDVFIEGESVFHVAMVIKGRVLIHNNGANVIVGSGSFLGVNDLYTGRYQSTYTAYDELLIYVFPINRTEEIDTILSLNKDYHGFMVASFYKMIYELDQIYQGLMKMGQEIYQFLKETYQEYIILANRNGYKAMQSDRISNLAILDNDLELVRDRINYYAECKNLPMDAVKLFYSYGNIITMYQIEDQVNIVNQLLDTLKELADSFIAMAQCLIDESDSCLFCMIADLAEKDKSSSDELMDILDGIIEKVNKVEVFTERMLGKKLKVDRKRMEEIYHRILTGERVRQANAGTEKYSKDNMKEVLSELKDSLDKLLEYAGIEEARAEAIRATMLTFIQMKDKFSTEDTARVTRRKLTEDYYKIYNRVFIRAYKEKTPPRLIDLFLKYGYADERLLTNEQLYSIYYLSEEEEPVQGGCLVYNIKEWLTLIYEGKRDPSKNEFDLEYSEMLAGLKKQGKLTEKEVKQWLTDPEKRLEYEIQNMFRYNNRTTNGQISSFVPVLHKDLWSNNIERMRVTSKRVNEAIEEIMKIDYSVFDREMLYANSEKKIVKEYIIKRVFPDIILMPNVGVNGIMWQEISGKRRDTSGRFLLPSFTDVNITTLLIYILGRYRWELCRTVEGASWNDIKHKSLTSEYSDYLQFYRKNKELSDEKKEKIKNQIQKGRNSSREIFTMDYEQWINYESKGALKLNKPVREIMATYCPFSKEIREHIKLQPLFEEAMARFYRDKQKKVREIEGRHRLLQKEQIELTPELMETLVYHRDL